MNRAPMMLAAALSLVCLEALAGPPAGDSKIERKGFTGVVRRSDGDAASNFSQDGEATTVLFDSMRIGLDSGHSLATVKHISLEFPLSKDHGHTKFHVYIRGFADEATAARSAIVVRVGDKTSQVDFAKATENYKKVGRRREDVKLPKIKQAKPEHNPDFVHSVEGDIPKDAEFLVITLIMVSDRLASGAQIGPLDINSLDIELD